MKATAQLVNGAEAKRFISRQASEIVRRKAVRASDEMVKLANKEMKSLFDLNRPGSRRRSPGSTRAAKALQPTIKGREFPLTVGYRVVGGDDVVARIIFMNFGTRAHEIRPSGKWPNRKALGPPQRLAWLQDGKWTKVPSTFH
uniref:hypothetical protein n=1 Tax=Gemmatimonas sp. TaxID=1962908 RepID=UPI003569B578